MAKLSHEQRLKLWEQLEELQEAFPYTEEGLLLFAQDVISTLIPGSPDLNPAQADILKYMLTGPKYRMVQAQRGQAKTTLAAIFAAFVLIHSPHFRIVIFSQTGKRAYEIANWVIKIFKQIDYLHFMLPDKSAGDKASSEAFDLHYVLKGGDKSPSVTCYSITSGVQGARADLIIPDDIESLQNSRSVQGREWLEEVSKEFESINQNGDILYLGTPQNMDSIYNNLPGRGYDIRIWPGRYPTNKELEHYGVHLAPSIRDAITRDPSLQTGYGLAGTSGAPTCPEMFDDELLCEKELSQGSAKFQLQYMLSTRLSDADRFPLKVSNLIFTSFGKDEGPVLPVWNSSPENRIQTTARPGNRPTDMFYRPTPRPYDWTPFGRKVMFIDPSGGGKNGDETAYGIVFQLGNVLYVYDMGGGRGGYDEKDLLTLVFAARDSGVSEVFIENNYGNGAHLAALRPLFQEHYAVSLEPVQSSGQKEYRIIDTLQPLVDSHRLVFNERLIDKDSSSIQHYPAEKRKTYSIFTQMSNITYDKNCLKHDDRLEAVQGACSQLVKGIDFDYKAKRNEESLRASVDRIKMMTDPRRRHREFYGGISSNPSRNRFNNTRNSKGTLNRF